VIYGAFFITIMSALVDIVYARLDPRIRPTYPNAGQNVSTLRRLAPASDGV
jgi:hypothetical protein